MPQRHREDPISPFVPHLSYYSFFSTGILLVLLQSAPLRNPLSNYAACNEEFYEAISLPLLATIGVFARTGDWYDWMGQDK
jgi:hypothetical protein